MDSCVPELLPEDKLSVSTDREKSPPSKEALLAPSLSAIDCLSDRTAAKNESFSPTEQSKLLVNELNCGLVAAGQRWWLSKGLEFSNLKQLLAGVAAGAVGPLRSGVGFLFLGEGDVGPILLLW